MLEEVPGFLTLWIPKWGRDKVVDSKTVLPPEKQRQVFLMWCLLVSPPSKVRI